MTTNIKITFNSEGFREILCGEGVKDVVSDEAQKIAINANGNLTDPDSEGFEADVFQGSMMSKYGYGGRWIGRVVAMDAKASADEAEMKSLSRAVT